MGKTKSAKTKHKKRHKKEKKSKKNKIKQTKKTTKEDKLVEQSKSIEPVRDNTEDQETVRKSLKPMTKEEWEKQQSVVRRVYDEATGRHRLIKGDGEVVEEIVSKERQRQINKQATLHDGLSYQKLVGMTLKKPP